MILKPSDELWLPPPADFQAKRVERAVELSWKSVDGTIRWSIERRTLEPTGWSDWRTMDTGKAPITAWRDDSPPARAVAYRVRALGLNRSLSDWSKTIYVRSAETNPTNAKP